MPHLEISPGCKWNEAGARTKPVNHFRTSSTLLFRAAITFVHRSCT